MKTKILFSLFIAAIFTVSCSKNDFTTKPQLKLESINDRELTPGELLKIELSFTDKEGDLTDSIFIRRVVVNKNRTFNDRLPIPPYTFAKKGKFLVQYLIDQFANQPGFGTITTPNGTIPDSCVFRFWVKDRGGNFSDTLNTPIIVIKK